MKSWPTRSSLILKKIIKWSILTGEPHGMKEEEKKIIN